MSPADTWAGLSTLHTSSSSPRALDREEPPSAVLIDGQARYEAMQVRYEYSNEVWNSAYGDDIKALHTVRHPGDPRHKYQRIRGQ